MKKLLVVLAVTAFGASPSYSQKLLPQGFGGWTASPQTAPPAAQASPFGPGVLDEYGLLSREEQTYSRGAEQLNVQFYRMADPTAAYGAFTYLQSPEMQALGVTKYSAGAGDRAIIVVGNFLLDVHGNGAASRSTDLKILAGILQPQSDRRPFPEIAQHLPEAGLVAGSERYIIGTWGLATFTPIANGDWAGFGQGAEAILAKYRRGSDETQLLVIEYPTQQIAGARAEKISALVTNAVPSKGKPAVIVQRTANLVSLGISENSPAYAQAVLKQVHFGHDVMWNEPSFKAKEPSLNVMVVGAFLGTGVILVLAIVSGLGFGIVRVVLKVFFPGKVFDRRRSIEIIQLGISTRPIDTKDLY